MTAATTTTARLHDGCYHYNRCKEIAIKIRVKASVAAALAAATGLLAGCLPSEPFAPLAVRLNGSGVEVVYTGCKASSFSRIKVTQVQSRTAAITSSDPVLWSVTLEPPKSLPTFTIGAHIAGGTTGVPLAAPLSSADSTYDVVDIYTPGGGGLEATFQTSQLSGGRVFYQDRYMTADEFAKQKCS